MRLLRNKDTILRSGRVKRQRTFALPEKRPKRLLKRLPKRQKRHAANWMLPPGRRSDRDTVSYMSLHKDIQREMAVRVARELAARETRLVYLESAQCLATKYFIEAGILPGILVPVNRDAAECRRIEWTMGVKARCADFFAQLGRYGKGSKVVAWADLMQNSIRDEDLLKAKRCDALFINLSTRACDPDVVMSNLHAQLHRCNFYLEACSKYRGNDGRHFMVHAYAIPKERKQSKV